MLSPGGQLTFNLTETHQLSVELLQGLDENNITVGKAAVALAMSLGRLLSPEPMTDEQEIDFIKALMDWGGAYFSEGSAN